MSILGSESAHVSSRSNEDVADGILVSVKQLAAKFDLSVRSIWRLDSAGKLPKPIRLGGSVRWRLDEIKRWIQAGSPSRREWEALEARLVATGKDGVR